MRIFFLAIILQTCVGSVIADDRDTPLTTIQGRYSDGKEVFHNRDKGHCLLCHQLSRSDERFQGNIGPALDGIAKRLDAQQIRYRIVDNSRLNSQTLMPAYFQTTGLVQVAPEFQEKTILSAQEIEDLVAYLLYDGEGH